jgi:hypothetical protein
MRASITIGGIEVALATPAGALEQVVAERYAPFLGACLSPACFLAIEPSVTEDEDRATTAFLEPVGETEFRIDRPGLLGRFDIVGDGVVRVGTNPRHVDDLLKTVFGLLAPHHEALMLRATGVIGDRGAHVFMGDPATPELLRLVRARAFFAPGLVVVRRETSGWLAASTPFCGEYQTTCPPRELRLDRLWSLQAGGTRSAAWRVGVTQAAVVKHAFLPTDAGHHHQLALNLAAEMADVAEFTDLRPGSSRSWSTPAAPIGRRQA